MQETSSLPTDETARTGPDVEPSRATRSSLGERLGAGGLDHRIPEEAGRWSYMLGGLTLAFLLVLAVTGVYLAQFYNPDPVGAHDSVLYIVVRAPLGDWVRSVHSWSAGAVTLTLTAHLALVFWRRSYVRPREGTWWAGVGMAGLVFLLVVTGTVLRWDQEGYEALAHFVAGGELVGAVGRFFTEGFTVSTPLLTRIYGLHVSALPLALAGLAVLHLWLVRRLGVRVPTSGATIPFRNHLVRLSGAALLGFALVGVLAVVAPEGLGHPPVAGEEVTKPFWPLLWVYGLENLLGMWGMVVGPGAVAAFLLAVPLLDRDAESGHGLRGWVGWTGAVLAAAVAALWLYGLLGETQQHLGM